ncbi:MAG: S8 family serine peptidase [Proteobacteria bacterium]|nr:S8 family serine peptidase [Pseudomonadota bacterium]
MRTKLLAVWFGVMAPLSAHAATVAIIDSGFDYEHEALQGKVWTKPDSTPEEGKDKEKDKGGGRKIGGLHGWNFADNNDEIIDYSQQSNYVPDIEKFLDLQFAASAGKATEGEKIWLQERLKDRDFLSKFLAFSSYAHGTHVAGIVAQDNPQVKLLAIKVISTKSRVRKLEERVHAAFAAGNDIDFIREFILKLGLAAIAYNQAQSLDRVADYLATTGVHVANGWTSIDMAQARGLVTPLLMVAAEAKPTPEMIEEHAEFFVRRVVAEETKILNKHPNILFVFAAGDDRNDNDQLPSAPEVVQLDHVLTVGATAGNVALAKFSNFGASHVDLFAPGVAIRSAVPRHDMYLPYSGTSLSAAQVSRLAALLKDKNPQLQAKDLRQILLGTIDRKDFLKGRAYTEGVINDERALLAAEQSLTKDLRHAIAAAKATVVDRAPTSESFDVLEANAWTAPF